jgi:predicted lipid-binding transport protein (Tim44 family)
VAEKDNVELQIRAKNLTKEAFAKASEALKALEDQQEQTTGKGSSSWGKLFGVISGGVAVGNLVSSAFKAVGGLLAQIPGQLIEIAKLAVTSPTRASFQG